MPAGRPTDYRPEYCDAVIEYGARGKSLAWMAAELDISRDTLSEWRNVHPEFSAAITRAVLKSQAWWEDFGQTNTLLAPGAGTFNSAVWIKNVASRFKHDWRDDKSVELSGSIGASLTDEQLLARIAALKAKVDGIAG